MVALIPNIQRSTPIISKDAATKLSIIPKVNKLTPTAINFSPIVFDEVILLAKEDSKILFCTSLKDTMLVKINGNTNNSVFPRVIEIDESSLFNNALVNSLETMREGWRMVKIISSTEIEPLFSIVLILFVSSC